MNSISLQQRPKIQTFMDLDAWKIGHMLVIGIYKITQKFPSEEKFGLTNQLRRAAVSITSNIAEGFSRRTVKEKQQFYATAMGSLLEIQNQILIAKDIGYLPSNEYVILNEQIIKVSKILSGLRRSAENYT